MSFSILLTSFLFQMKLDIQRSNVKISLVSISMNSVVPKREIRKAFLSQEFSLAGCLFI